MNATFVRRLGITDNPVGTRFRIDDGPATPIEIVGLVQDTKHSTLREEFTPFALLDLLLQYGADVNAQVTGTKT